MRPRIDRRTKSAPAVTSVSVESVAEIATDLWRIAGRAKAGQSLEKILLACERAEDRLKRLGVEIVSLEGKSYDSNMQVKVLEHEGGEKDLIVSECLTPAIYYQGVLIREAEVITKGA